LFRASGAGSWLIVHMFRRATPRRSARHPWHYRAVRLAVWPLWQPIFLSSRGRLGGVVDAGWLPNRVHIASQHAILLMRKPSRRNFPSNSLRCSITGRDARKIGARRAGRPSPATTVQKTVTRSRFRRQALGDAHETRTAAPPTAIVARRAKAAGGRFRGSRRWPDHPGTPGRTTRRSRRFAYARY
jgi:hypothetical protein